MTVAGSQFAGSVGVRTCRTAQPRTDESPCDSPLHTACVKPPALAGAVDCGRKKLPFAGYSVVKESVKLSALQLLEVRLRPFGLRRDSLSPNLWARVHSQQARVLLRARRHSPELAIVTSASPECKLKRQSIISLTLPRSTFALRGYGATTSRLARRGLPSRSSLPLWLRSARASAERRLVENTGLEPVTSWLQTRRSPS